MKKSIQLGYIILTTIATISIALGIQEIRKSEYLIAFRQGREELKEKVILTVFEPKKDFVSFREAIGFNESSNRYHIKNRFGYIGKYQFGRLALIDAGIKNKSHFLSNPNVQDNAFKNLCRINKFRLRKHIKEFAGRTINGIKISESGLIASSHLVGAEAVKRYLRSNGRLVVKDGNNVSIENYLKKFKDYNLNLIAIRKV